MRHALRFIFQPEVIQLLAWGTIRLKFNEEWKIFPGIIQKLSTKHMWRAYRDRASDADGAEADIYDRSVILRLVPMMTRVEQKSKSSVDYILGALVHENLETVGRIVDQEMGDVRRRKELEINLQSL